MSFTRELFGDMPPAALAERVDEYREAFEAAPSTLNGQRELNVTARTLTKVEAPQQALTKSFNAWGLSGDQVAAIEAAIGSTLGDGFLQKDLSPTSPLSTGYVAFDLEAPAKMLVPRPTPLRNRLPRLRGVGLAHRFKRITGFSGSGTGGVGAINPGFTDATQTNFSNPGSANALYFNRPRKISYAGDETILPYVQQGLSDELSWWTQFSSLGFQDNRAISRSSTLYACMLAEEREILYGRGTLTGYAGALAAPTGTPTGVARTAATGESVVTGAVGAKIYVKVVAELGDFGVSQAGTVSTSSGIAVTNGTQVVDITIPTAVTGATGYKVFVSTGTSDPGDASRWLYTGAAFPNGKSVGRTPTLTLTIQGALPTSGQSVAAYTTIDNTSVNLASGDGLSGRPDNYDGIFTWLTGSGGYTSALNAPFSTSNAGGEFQTVFSALYDSVKADPDEAWMQGGDRKQLSDTLKGNSSSNYRITVAEDQTGSIKLGDVVTAVQNEVTGKVVELNVHPWLPQGNTLILSNTLPIPDSNVGQAWVLHNVQDYMAVDWPVTQMSYDTSVWWSGTLSAYAPAWSGLITGIVPA